VYNRMMFASGAEAVAHYYKQGYDVHSKTDDYRMMMNKDGRIVRIYHVGLLEWKATEYA